jgi:cytochrome P450
VLAYTAKMAFLPDLPKMRIPGPKPLPFMGPTGNLLRFLTDPVGWLLRLRREYGLIAALAEDHPAMVFAFGPEHNRRVLLDPGVLQHNTQMLFPVAADSAVRRLNTSLVMMNGEQHRRQRRLMTPAFQKAAVDAHRDTIVGVAERALRRLRPGHVVDLSKEMIDLSLGVALRCLFGLDASNSPDDLGRLATQHLEGLTSAGAIMLPVDLPGTPYAKLMRVSERFEAGMQRLIRDKRRAPADAKDVLSILIRAKDEDGSVLTETELLGQCALLFLAGHETTAYTLSWTLFLLSQHPRILADLRDELRQELHGDAPTVAQLARLPLLDAVVKESMRILPVTLMLFIRVGAEGFELGPYQMPKGSALFLSPLVTHREPALYPSPRRFLPARWSSIQPSSAEYLPFGMGPRMCLGAGFGALSVRLLLAMIVQHHGFTLAPFATVSHRVRGITLGPRHGLPMRVSRAGAEPSMAHVARVRGDIHDLVDLSPG